MVRLALALALASAACGTTTDDRPRTIQYVTEAVLSPNCGDAQCHSTFRQAKGEVFDTVEGTRQSLVHGLISFDFPIPQAGQPPGYDPEHPENAQLIEWITQTDPLGLGIGRMPYDHPIPNEDVTFLEEYIREGAPGAQCDPAGGATGNGHVCNKLEVHQCNSDWTFGDLIETCAMGCINGTCQ